MKEEKHLMKIKTLVLILAVCTPLSAFADNVGQCGWGSKLFDGQQGIAPQVLAVTTNGTSGNQTFGISFGTSGCTQKGIVKSAWKTAAYVDANMNKLARDMSRGQGESLDTLASLLNVTSNDKEIFASALKANFNQIFASDSVTYETVLASLRNVLVENPALAGYATSL